MKGGGGKKGGGTPGKNPCARKGGGIIIGAGGKPFTLFGDSTRIGDGIELTVSFIMLGRPSVTRNVVKIEISSSKAQLTK